MKNVEQGQRAAKRFGAWCLAAVLLLPAGCNSGARSKQALEMYERGEYAAALGEASALARNTAGVEQERASLVAGMSAYELKKYGEAEQWLRPASRSADQQIAGRASATLGLVGVARERYSVAALDLSTAGRKLTGNDAAQSNFFAGECYNLLGRLDAARKSYALALATAEDPQLRSRIEGRMNASDFTLQLGAFSNKTNADKAVATAGSRAQRAGLPTPTVVSTPDATGRTIYLVQTGRFKTRGEAQAARLKLGTDAVVAPVR